MDKGKGKGIFEFSYFEIKEITKRTIVRMLTKTKGNILTFKLRDLIREMNLRRNRLTIIVLSCVLEELQKEGFVTLYKNSPSGRKYMAFKRTVIPEFFEIS